MAVMLVQPSISEWWPSLGEEHKTKGKQAAAMYYYFVFAFGGFFLFGLLFVCVLFFFKEVLE